MKLSLGPITYYWPQNQIEDFYLQLIDSPVDIIYLGETVCSKRQQLSADDWINLAAHLSSFGKEIVLSSLALIESRSDIRQLQKLCDNTHCLIEANDMSAIDILTEKKLPFIAGASINIYNAQTLRILHEKGLTRWVMPVELNRHTLHDILNDILNDMTLNKEESAQKRTKIETEIFSYGKLPLAYSARCFTARAKNLPKDNCQWQCIEHPNGLPVYTQENDEIFTINGVQVQSAYIYNLINEKEVMDRIGVDIMRISPQKCLQSTQKTIEQFSRVLSNPEPSISLIPQTHCNGYWYGKPGISMTNGVNN